MSNTEKLAKQLKKDYRHRYGLRELKRGICACMLSDSRRCMGRKITRGRCRPPRADHSSTFKVIRTRELVLVEQPYAGPYQDSDGNPKSSIPDLVAASEAFAVEWGLTVRVSPEESWHSPGQTVLVEYRRKKQ